jgi:hypothetical protein
VNAGATLAASSLTAKQTAEGDTMTVTLSWVDPMTAELVELDVSDEVADALERGEPVTWRGESRPRRTPNREALAALRDRQEQIRRRMDEIVTGYPEAKSLGPSR